MAFLGKNNIVSSLFNILRLLFKKTSFYIYFLSVIIFIFFSQKDKLQHIRALIQYKIAHSINSLVMAPKDRINQIMVLYDENLGAKKYNILLKQENEILKQYYHQFIMLDSENKELRKLLGFLGGKQFNHITTRVVMQNNGSNPRSVVVMAGRKDGILKNNIIVNSDGLVGRIIELGEDTSRILLIDDFSSRIPVRIIGSKARAVLKGGEEGGLLTMQYLPDKHNLKKGDLVVTSADADIFPPDIIIGTIHSVNGAKVTVLPSANLYSLDYVSILK